MKKQTIFNKTAKRKLNYLLFQVFQLSQKLRKKNECRVLLQVLNEVVTPKAFGAGIATSEFGC
jgi:hypothetical protein